MKRSNPAKAKEKDKGKHPKPQAFIESSSDYITDSEVEEHFSKFLDEMNLDEAKRIPLVTKSIQEKRQMLQTVPNINSNNPAACVDDLKRIANRHITLEKVSVKLESLRICLSNSPVSWVKEFNKEKNNGLQALVSVLALYIDCPEIVILCLKCLRAFGNVGYGLFTLIKSKETLLHVALCLVDDHPNVMLLALELLIVVSFYSFEGHCNVMEAMYMSMRLRSYDERFLPIINGLVAGLVDKHYNLITMCLAFMNVIVNPNFTDNTSCACLDLSYRLHLRLEFTRCGFNNLLPQLIKIDDVTIARSIQVFQSDSDFEEDCIQKLQAIKASFQDRNSVYQLLNRSIINTNSDPYLTSVLQHLLIINDSPIRYHVYRLIDNVVSELIIRSDGLYTDAALNMLEPFNLGDLFEKFHDPSFQRDAKELQDKLDKVLEEKYEAEIKLTSLANKIEQNHNSAGDSHISVNGAADSMLPPPPTAPPLPGAPKAPPLPGNVVVPPPPPGIGLMSPPPPPPGIGLMPPPPPGAVPFSVEPKLPFGMLIKSTQKPKNPLKKANWTKIDIKLLDQNCIWKKINDSDNLKISEILNELDYKFSTRLVIEAKDDESGSINYSYSNTSRKIKDFKVLGTKSGQNLGILLGALKTTPDEIKRRILELDEGLLSQSNVENILKNLPSSEELLQLHNMSEDYENLNEIEQFGCTLGSVKKIHSRLQCLLSKMQFDERISEVKPALLSATESLMEVRKSSTFPKILEIVLGFGNFMNSTSKSTQTIGFSIGFLTKLAETKDNVSELTLMDFLVRKIQTRFPSLLNIVNEFTFLDKAARVSVDNVNFVINDLITTKSNLERELKAYKKQSDNDSFADVMREFLDRITEQLAILSDMNTKLQLTYKDMGRYLTFDLVKYPMELFFEDMKKFKDDFNKSLKEIEMESYLESKRQKAKEEHVRRERDKSNQIQASGLKHSNNKRTTVDDDKSVLDQLMEALKSGEAYGNSGGGGDLRKKQKHQKKQSVLPLESNNHRSAHNVNRSRSRRDFDYNLVEFVE